MVCKEDVVLWFKGLKSHTRIDVMCNLFNLCLPFELRFLGTCLEDLGKRDFHDLRTTESGANNPSELGSPDLQCISNKRARIKLALYISLLHSCNYACSNGYYKILANVEEVNNLIKCNGMSNTDDEVLEELLLIYTLALNHPAFTVDQKLFLGEVFTKLKHEEEKRNYVNRTKRSFRSTDLEAIDKRHAQFQVYQSCSSPEQHLMPPPNNSSQCPPNPTPAALTGDPLVSMAEPLIGYLPYSLMASYPTMMLPPHPPEQRSPMVSRTNSPCQSNSPSRPGSPGRPKPLPTSFSRPPPAVDTLPLPHAQYFPSKKTSLDQLRQCSDDELRENGFDSQCISPLRHPDARHHTTNGYNLGPKKPPLEHDAHKDLSGSSLRRYNSMEGPLNPSPFYIHPSCICVMGYPRPHPANAKSLPHHIINHVKSMSLDHDVGSNPNSSSDSASDHSPPDTPSLSTNTTDRVMMLTQPEIWDEQRNPELVGRGRGMSRHHRPNPPGIPTHSRGRGNNSSQRRRDANMPNGTADDRKVYTNSDNGGGMAFPYGQFPLPNHFVQAYPSFMSQGGVIRFPIPQPNGDMLYHSMPPPQQYLPSRPAPPSHVAYSPLVPPPKILSCYNCGSQGHPGSECPDATIEEITNKGQYKIDYTNNLVYQKSGEGSTTQEK